jgi:hypothetical protein
VARNSFMLGNRTAMLTAMAVTAVGLLLVLAALPARARPGR